MGDIIGPPCDWLGSLHSLGAMTEWSSKAFKHAEHPRTFANAVTIDKTVHIYGGQLKGTSLTTSLQIQTGKGPPLCAALVSFSHFLGGLKTMVWTKGLGSAPSPRVRNTACVVDDKSLIVFGGQESEPLNDVFAYNISTSPSPV